MIKIILCERLDMYYVCVDGHVGSKGSSIICASVSVLLETLRLSLYALEDVKISYRDGHMEESIPKTFVSEILFRQLCIGLCALHRKFRGEIDLLLEVEDGFKEGWWFG